MFATDLSNPQPSLFTLNNNASQFVRRFFIVNIKVTMQPKNRTHHRGHREHREKYRALFLGVVQRLGGVLAKH